MCASSDPERDRRRADFTQPLPIARPGTTLVGVGLDDHFDLDTVVDRVLAQLVEEHGEEWVVERSDRLEAAFGRAVETALMDATPLVQDLKAAAPEMLEERRRGRHEYRKMIEEHWAQAFDLYEVVLRLAFEAGTDFGETRAERLDGQRVFVVLNRLHARGCRIAEEILVLLKNGYGQGALARWRTLHEVTCTAIFIAEHDEDVAERYLLHEVVESWQAMKDYERCASALDYEPLAEGELEHAREQVDRLIEQFGKAFKEPYGWAADALARDPGVKGVSGFAAIEKAVELNHLRALYRCRQSPDSRQRQRRSLQPRPQRRRRSRRPEPRRPRRCRPLRADLAYPADRDAARPGHGSFDAAGHRVAAAAGG